MLSYLAVTLKLLPLQQPTSYEAKHLFNVRIPRKRLVAYV